MVISTVQYVSFFSPPNTIVFYLYKGSKAVFINLSATDFNVAVQMSPEFEELS